MIGKMGNPLYATFPGPSIYRRIFEMSPVVGLNSFRGAMSSLDSFLEIQYGVLGGSMGYCICIMPPRGCLHHEKHITLVQDRGKVI